MRSRQPPRSWRDANGSAAPAHEAASVPASARIAVCVAVALLIHLAAPLRAAAAAAGDLQPVAAAPAGERDRGHASFVSRGVEMHPFARAVIDHPLARLRELYFAAVEDRVAIDAALEEVEVLRDAGLARPGSRRAAVLDAYVGAITTLRAKHGRWPPDRLRHLNDGLARLDRAVSDAPDVAEIRYLRLMSCYYLPGILGRGSTVREDFAALARLLPRASPEFPPELYRAMVAFVIEHGELDAGSEATLEAAAAAADAGTE